MKKKLIAIALVVAMLGVAVVSGTLAYFTDTDEAINIFTIGGIDIELEETVKVTGENGTEFPDRVHKAGTVATYSNIMPTNKLAKTPVITNTGKNPAYVRAVVIVNNWLEIYSALRSVPEAERDTLLDSVFDGWNVDWANDYDHLIATNPDNKFIAVDSTAKIINNYVLNPENWFKNDSDPADTTTWWTNSPNVGGYYARILNEYEMCFAYYMHLDAGESVTLFNGLNVPAKFDNDDMKMFDGLKIEVYADAIQTEGFATAGAKAAFEELEAAHPMAAMRSNIVIPDLETTDYVVADAEGLAQALGSVKKGDVITLASDIDLAECEWPVINTGYNVFTLDGNNFAIKNLTVKDRTTAALIASADGGVTVKNLTLENFDITAINDDGESSAAALIAFNDSHPGTVVLENVTVKNSNITGGKYAGGIVGYANDSCTLTLKDCKVIGSTITSTFYDDFSGATSNLNYTGHLGGMVAFWRLGSIEGGSVENVKLVKGEDTGNNSAKWNRTGAVAGTFNAVSTAEAPVEIKNVTLNGAAFTDAEGNNASTTSVYTK